jgi:uncharacterized protein (DUF1501 family)
MKGFIRAAGALALALAFSGAHAAEQGADFYRGAVVSIIVCYGPGGGYDQAARVLAKHYPRFLPGERCVIVCNMPGGGTVAAANYVYNTAARDGSVLGIYADILPLASPDSRHPFGVHPPPSVPQHRRNPTIAIAAVLDSESYDVGCQGSVIIGSTGLLALRGTMLAQNQASEPLGDTVFDDNMIHAGAATRGAQKFPEAASFRVSFSSVKSETARRSRVFSASSSFSRFT